MKPEYGKKYMLRLLCSVSSIIFLTMTNPESRSLPMVQVYSYLIIPPHEACWLENFSLNLAFNLTF